MASDDTQCDDPKRAFALKLLEQINRQPDRCVRRADFANPPFQKFTYMRMRLMITIPDSGQKLPDPGQKFSFKRLATSFPDLFQVENPADKNYIISPAGSPPKVSTYQK